MRKLDQRDLLMLRLIAESPQSRNSLYVKTSPACLRTGRKRSIGTYGWKKPEKLVKLELVHRSIRKPQGYCHTKRHTIRYTYTITDRGLFVLGRDNDLEKANQLLAKIVTRQVYKAEPYRWGEMGSFGKASGMLIRQFQFPDTYSVITDEFTSSDHDRMLSWDYDHWSKTVEEFKPKIDGGLEHWFRNGKAEDVLAFLVKAHKATGTWTGFRILGTVNRSNGYPVYTLEIFRKGPGSITRVYSGSNAPNVNQPKRFMTVMGTYEDGDLFLSDYDDWANRQKKRR